LRKECEKKILDELDQSNAFIVFNIGQRYQSDELKVRAFEEIKKMFPHIDLPDSMMDQPEKIKKLEEINRNLKSLSADIHSN
jgi:hypothetical protein